MRARFVSLLFWAVLLSPLQAWAIRSGEVSGPSATVHEKGDARSKVVTRLFHGVKLKIADNSKDGWVAVLLPAPMNGLKFGWVRLTELRVAAAPRRGGDSGSKKWNASLFLGSSFVTPASMQDKLGLDSTMVPALGFGAEFSRRLFGKFWLGLHAELLSLDRELTEVIVAGYTGSAKTFYVQARYDLLDTGTWILSGVLGGGPSFGSVGLSSNGGTPKEGSFSTVGMMGGANVTRMLNRSWAICATAGYRLLSASAIQATSAGGIVMVDADFSGPFASVGVVYRF